MKKYIYDNKFLKFYKLGVMLFLIIFCLGVILGYTYNYKIDMLGQGKEEAFWNIFRNNFLIGLSFVSLGTLTGGIYSALAIGINGYIVGQVCGYLIDKNMMNNIISGLLPHILFELIGLICFALISCIPIRVLFKWIKNDESLNYKYIIQIKYLFLTGVLLLAIAAFIESKISTVL